MPAKECSKALTLTLIHYLLTGLDEAWGFAIWATTNWESRIHNSGSSVVRDDRMQS